VLVTLRAARSVAVLGWTGTAIEEVDRVEVGTEPVGIVAREDGERVWVALSTDEAVVELDRDLQPLRRLPVAGRPTWLAVHPSGRTLYVGEVVGGALHCFDVSGGSSEEAEDTLVEFPVLVGMGRQGPLDFLRRVTGDPAVNPDGTALAIPTLWADDQSAPNAEHQGGETSAAKYAALGLGLSVVNPALALLPLDADGLPAGEAAVVYVAGFAPDDPERVAVVRSTVASAAWSPDGAAIYATMEASRTVAVLSADAARWVAIDGGFMQAPSVFAAVGEGPRGVAFAGGTAWIHTFLDGSVSRLDESVVAAAISDDPAEPACIAATLAALLHGGSLDPTITLGRSYFYTATNPLIVEASAGVSCSTCHFEGRTDGITWPTDSGIRQVPSLAGKVSETTPLTWTANVATVAEEARITSQERLGGAGATDADLQAITVYIDFIRAVDQPGRYGNAAAVARGKAVFERSDVGCSDCHSGPRYTDRAAHDLFGLEGVDTPSLNGVAVTAPYLHDGRAATLGEVVEAARRGEMGVTAALSDAEAADLVVFLRSL
jgi:DNA-binding beta-propeller fold protein YncE